jgi:hypothetical protein
LDFCIATTFSLDLLALLTAPLAFTFFDWEDDEGRPTADPLALLEGIRRHADRIAVFCQEGQIAVPKKDQRLFTYLEPIVHHVSVPRENGVFHPKVWVLRFSASDQPVCFRLVCLSRNLTFDRSWDTSLVLDGALRDRKNAFAVNRPLGDFIAALPALAAAPLQTGVRQWIDRIQDEIRRVHFELPEGFEKLTFLPIGVDGAVAWPFYEEMGRTLVISPFLADAALEHLSKPGRGDVLISRSEELDKVAPKILRRFSRVLAMSGDAEVEGDGEAPPTADLVSDDAAVPSGLHAKIYLTDAGWDGHLWVGSANATNAAFNNNVEFLVELVGKKSRFGIDTLLKVDENSTSFASLLQEYEVRDEEVEIDAEQQELEDLVDSLRTALIRTDLTAHVETVAGRSEEYRIVLSAAKPLERAPEPSTLVECWPISLRQETGAAKANPSRSIVAEFDRVSFDALTTFFAFEVAAERAGKKAARRFVLNLPLNGAPRDRQERVLLSLLRDKEQVLRFLLLLLSYEEGDVLDGLSPAWNTSPGADGWAGAVGGGTLFESLVKALHRDPARLDAVASLVEDLRKTSDASALLPEGFDGLWEPIWRVREGLRK